MKYSTRIHHYIDGPCEFSIFDKDPYGATAPTAVIFAVGGICTAEGTNWPNGYRSASLSQAVLSPRDAIDRLERFRADHKVVTETIPEGRLRKWAPELGALMGLAPEIAETAATETIIDTNAAVVAAFESGAPVNKFES